MDDCGSEKRLLVIQLNCRGSISRMSIPETSTTRNAQQPGPTLTGSTLTLSELKTNQDPKRSQPQRDLGKNIVLLENAYVTHSKSRHGPGYLLIPPSTRVRPPCLNSSTVLRNRNTREPRQPRSPPPGP